MNVSDALEKRISTRAFLEKPLTQDAIREILKTAARAPSGGNLQPWRVHALTGDGLVRFRSVIDAAIAENPMANESEIAIYPPKLGEPYRTRRFTVGEAMYDKIGIPREDKFKRLEWFKNNFSFFGAPAALFFSIDRQFDKGQWAHLGMFMQSIALIAVERGLATCMQECWAMRAKTVSEFLGLHDDQQLYCGMALGYADENAPVNSLRTERASVDEFTIFVDQ